MQLANYDFTLPPELIATQPVTPRDHCRLLVVNRSDGSLTHARFNDLAQWIHPDDLLVLNNSRVIPARLQAEGGAIEILLTEETSPRHWLAMGHPTKKLKANARITIEPLEPSTHPRLEVEVLRTLPDGQRVLRFFQDFDLAHYGQPPLPPYIMKARKAQGQKEISAEDTEWYQTIFAAQGGSVAAPTAGLHFTPELLEKFQHAFVTLHVGIGTFRPVKVADIRQHEMHEERFSIPEGLAAKAKAAKRVVAVGTTAARVMESRPGLSPGEGRTSIFIHPPYTPKRVDALITNFHFPKSTLLMLVAALMGVDLQRRAYAEAIAQKYRFYSYGDAMLIL